ncbi:MAG: hypothetical protein VW999_03605 [Alphaproteobacteria bacterium]
MVVEITPLGSVAQNGAPAKTESTSTPSGSAAPVAKPQQEGAAAVSAPTPQNANDEAQDEPKEEPRRKPVGSSLADLGGTRLSILQDSTTERFVYRGLNSVTKEVERQFPTEADLARSAFLREIKGSFVDEQT